MPGTSPRRVIRAQPRMPQRILGSRSMDHLGKGWYPAGAEWL
jgi:hypothetical protein